MPNPSTKDILDKYSRKLESQIDQLIQLINNAERPLLILGNGIKLAKRKGNAIIVVDAENRSCFKYWRKIVKTKNKKNFRFVFISQLPNWIYT